MPINIISITLAVLSAILLRLCWQKKGSSWLALRLTGWGALLTCAAVWSSSVGPEFGIAFSFLTFSVSAWAMVGLNSQFRARKLERKKMENKVNKKLEIRDYKIAYKIGIFFTAGPLTIICTAFLSITLCSFLPLEKGNIMVTTALLYPVVFAIASYIICMNRRPLRDGIFMASSASLSAAYLFVLL